RTSPDFKRTVSASAAAGRHSPASAKSLNFGSTAPPIDPARRRYPARVLCQSERPAEPMRSGMERILERLLSRPSLQTAQMAGAAIRTELARDPRKTMSGLAAWSRHPDPLVRIASAVGYGFVGTRDRDALPDVLPHVERLANDKDPEV